MATSINDTGWVVGSYTATNGVVRGFVYNATDGFVYNLSSLLTVSTSSRFSYPQSINNSYQITGYSLEVIPYGFVFSMRKPSMRASMGANSITFAVTNTSLFQSLILESSSNLINWTAVATNVSFGTTTSFSTPYDPAAPARMFRLKVSLE